MGQKVNPISFRLGNLYTWNSSWYANKRNFKDILLEDLKLREFLMKRLKLAEIVGVNNEQSTNKIKIVPQVTRPGIVIGRGGSELEERKKALVKMVSIPEPEKNLEISPEEVKTPELSAFFVAQRIAEQIEKRMPHRYVVLKAIERTMNSGAKGIKVALSGRINGAEIARREKYSEGTIPLQTLRAKIDFAEVPALTRSGYVGVKVWIYQGEENARA